VDELRISDLIDEGTKAITGQAERSADVNKGSDYVSLIGPPAIIWTREDRRDEDQFKATRFHTATGYDLTYLVKNRYGVDRILETNGVGTAKISRSTAAGGAGTVWAGTRFAVYGSNPRYYRATSNVAVSAGALGINIPIEAERPGTGYFANDSSNIGIQDSLWDSTFTVSSIVCADGTNFEEASALIARVRQSRIDSRVGQVKSMEAACKAAGASKVLIFRSDYGGTAVDAGLNMIYVGDEGYQGSPSLVKACFIALRNSRVLGDHSQVLELNRVILNPVIDVYLAKAPALYDLERLQRIHTAAVTQYLGGTSGGFAFTKIGILSAVASYTPEVQRVVVVNPAVDVSVLTSGHFPPVLNRYVVGTVALRYHGP
jgi:hypothetical protein